MKKGLNFPYGCRKLSYFNDITAITVTQFVKNIKPKSTATKEEFIKRILQDPKSITSSDFDLLISHEDENQRINSLDLKRLFLRIYDLNNTSELGQAHKGLMGRLNRRSN